MQISKLRVLNYKGFQDSGWLDVSQGFTVVIGQNNSGKTALLESFRLTGLNPRPHRSLSRNEATPLDPTSRVEILLNVTGLELLQGVLRHGTNQVWIPCPRPVADANRGE